MALRLCLCVLTPALLVAPALACAADDSANQRYGLTTTQVLGVSVTRGKPKPLPKRAAARSDPAPRAMSLDRGYRGPVFGQHHIVRDGQHVLRTALRPVQWRADN